MRAWRNNSVLVALALWLTGCATLPYSGARFHPGYHAVQRGETLYSIAWRFDLNYRNLARWNGLSPPYTIYPGQRLRMSPPSTVRQASTSEATTSSVSVSERSTTSVTKQAVQQPVPRTTAHYQARQRSPESTASTNLALHWIWPTQGRVIEGFSDKQGGNLGIDIAGRRGQPIIAAIGGQVVYSGDGLPSYGKLLIIQHNEHYLTAYAHNNKLLVHEGDVVRQGQEIATLGRSGTDVQEPMLHFEIRRDGDPVDPMHYLPKR